MTTHLVVGAIALFSLWKGFSLSMEEWALGSIMIWASLRPSILWSIVRYKSIPLLEVYVLLIGFYYAIPMIMGINDSFRAIKLDQDVRIEVGLIAILSIIAVQIGWNRSRRTRKRDIPLKIRVIPHKTAVNIFIFFLITSVLYQIATQLGYTYQYIGVSLSNAANILMTSVLGTVSNYVLCRLIGEGTLNKKLTYMTFALILIGTITIAYNLMLLRVIEWILPAILGYILGSGRIPWKTMILLLVSISFLSIGKGAARTIYWDYGYVSTIRTTIPNIASRFLHWSQLSWEYYTEDTKASRHTTLMTRINLSGMVGIIVKKTPDDIPYLYGETYSMLPIMLMPRVFWPDKPSGHAATELLGFRYGVHEHGKVISTSIGLGLLGEAYANFGFIGTIVLSYLIGSMFGIAFRFAAYAPPLSLRGFILIVLLSAFTKVEYTLSEIIIPFIQISLILFLVYSWLFVWRRFNPQQKRGGAIRSRSY